MVKTLLCSVFRHIYVQFIQKQGHRTELVKSIYKIHKIYISQLRNSLDLFLFLASDDLFHEKYQIKKYIIIFIHWPRVSCFIFYNIFGYLYFSTL